MGYTPARDPDQNNISILCKKCHRAPDRFHGKNNREFHNLGTDSYKDSVMFKQYLNIRKTKQEELKHE